MPLRKYEFAPGINKQVTDYGGENLWIDSENVRFRYGQPEKIGGWEKLSTSKIIGVVRGIHAWTALDGTRHLALGTDRKLYVYKDGTIADITPIRASATGDGTAGLTGVQTTNASTTITVTDSAHGASAGDFVTIDTVSEAVGGITAANMAGEFEILTVPSASTYTITAGAAATSDETDTSVTGNVAYQITPQPATSTYGYGWGTGYWGGLTLNPTTDQLNEALDTSETAIDVDDGSTFSSGNYILIDQETMKVTGVSSNTLTVTRAIEDPDDDTVATTGDSHAAATHADNTTVYLDNGFIDWGQATTSSNITLASGYWSFDNFGEDLLALSSDGKLYRWDTSSGTSSRAAVISAAPTASKFLLVSSPDRHIFLMGTETTIGTTTTQDDLYLRFSSQEDYDTWAPSATNTAGSFRIQDGSKIVTAVRSRGTNLVWTDTSLHSLQYIGPPYTFGMNQIAANCGAVSPGCAVDVNGKTYWMSQQAFYAYDGAVSKLPCSVQDYVFDDFNTTQEGLVYAGVNTDFNEITWFYASKDSSYIDRNVTYNYLEDSWYTNSLARTTWLDRGVYDQPYATEYSATVAGDTPTVLGVTAGSSIIYSHEVGDDNVVAALPAFLQSGDFDIEDGEQMLSIQRMIPDFKDQKGSATVMLSLKNYPATTSATTLNGAITGTSASAATGGGSTVILTDSSNFPSSGTILVGTELISYTSNTTATGVLGGLTRGVSSTTAATHIDNKKVLNYTNVRINRSTVTPLIKKTNTRGRGRQANVLISSEAVGDKWRFGTLRLDVRPDGGR